MGAIVSINATTPPLQSSVGMSRLAQARREADQAEANAKDLRAQANDAERQSQRSNANVRDISARVQQEKSTYTNPQKNSEEEVPRTVQALIEKLYAATAEKRTLIGNPLKSTIDAAPVINIQGQFTGRIVNVRA